ncbi:hypothetical protein U9M48_021228 [Paspalum notatum var. saurae]
MPLYDCMMLVKPLVTREVMAELVARVARRAYQRNGVVTEVKCFGKVNLGYGIKKLDGRHYQGHLMQMTMMVPPSFPQELHYLNKEDRLLRWLVVKHREAVYGLEFINEDDGKYELGVFSHGDKEDDHDIELGSDADDEDFESDGYEYEIETEDEKDEK